MKKKTESATTDLEKIKQTESANEWRDKGIDLVKEGRDREALEAFMKAIELDPKYTVPRRTKFLDLLGFGKNKEARKAEKLAKKRAGQKARERVKREATKAREAKKLAEERAEQEAREQAEREAAEAEKAEKLAKKKAEQEAREQAKREAEEARKAEKLVKKKAEQEAREQAKREAEEARKAEKLAKKKAEQEAREQAKRKAEEAIEAEKLAKKRAEQEAIEKAKREAEEARKAREAETEVYSIDSELFTGDVRLDIQSTAGFERVEQFKRSLGTVENLKVTLDSWSEDEGIIIVVSLQVPMPLGNILSQMPSVEEVYKNRQNVVVVLKA